VKKLKRAFLIQSLGEVKKNLKIPPAFLS